MNIFLVRHTEYDNPDHVYPFRLPVWLSEEGRRHATKIGEWFLLKGLMKLPIFSSPIVRAVQTAELIAARTDSFVSIDERLIERYSGMQGVPLVDWNELTEEFLAEHETESCDAMWQRMKVCWDEKVALDQDLIMIGHGDPITLFYEKMVERDKIDMQMSADGYVQKGEIVWFRLEDGKIVGWERVAVNKL